MDNDFTADEIKDAVRIVRVHCPGFSEDDFESLMELERRITDSGYLEAVLGLIRLEEEKGISCTEALDTCEKLINQKTKLEQEIPDLQERAEDLIRQINQANAEYEQVKKAIANARKGLEQVRSEYAAEEKKLENLLRKFEKEKQRISKEVEDAYQQASINKEEIGTAGKIKAEIESHGYTLELALDLAKEFAGHKNAREQLAEGLKEHGSLNKYLDELHDGATKEREKLVSEIRDLESQKKAITSESGNLKNILTQLQADVTYEEELRRFHRRYFPLCGLLDELSTWPQVFFMRCAHPASTVAGVFDRKKGNHHFWTDRPPIACPVCGYPVIQFDMEIYSYLGCIEGQPLVIHLGE
jgi:predicted  nucleic acid-binding Zn-ribbon protein